MNKIKRFIVHRSYDYGVHLDYDVILIPIKGTNKYHFVNLTKGHICTCEFDSIEDGIKDLEERKKQGLIIDYEEN